VQGCSVDPGEETPHRRSPIIWSRGTTTSISTQFLCI